MGIDREVGSDVSGTMSDLYMEAGTDAACDRLSGRPHFRGGLGDLVPLDPQDQDQYLAQDPLAAKASQGVIARLARQTLISFKHLQ
jgi:hypothetical protein